MRNQYHTEPTAETTYAPPAIAQTELAVTKTQDAQTTQAVHQWLAQIQRKARREKARHWGGLIFFQALLFPLIWLPNSFPAMREGRLQLVTMALMFAPAIGMLTLVLRTFLKKPTWNAEELARIGGVEAVGTLLELIGVPKSPRQLTPLLVALTELLPQMKASDAGLLTAAQRKTLNWTLKNDFAVYGNAAALHTYRLAILKALEQVGDASAIPFVAQLANGKARTANQIALKAAAQECLPLLMVNFGGVEATKTLLRAASPENAAPDTLLRPAAFAPDAKPNELLRPADSGSSSVSSRGD